MANVTMQGFAKKERTLIAPDTMTNADVGKVVVLDTTANTIKLASDGDIILGILEQVEDRRSQAQGVLATVAFEFGQKVSYTGTLAVNDLVVANGGGGVRAVGVDDTIPGGVVLPRVFEVDSTAMTAVIDK